MNNTINLDNSEVKLNCIITEEYLEDEMEI